jgi:transcriptional regulator with PAS, ATPase and Fis domain
LDEINEIPLRLQAKLLRAIQEREIMRLGEDSVIPVDIRIIAATNKNLEALTKEQAFRQDLFFRLDVLRLTLPALNERREDIPLLVEDFIRHHYPDLHIEYDALQLLQKYNWYGNVRHLFNICERLAVLKRGGVIKKEDVEYELCPNHSTSYFSFIPLDNDEKAYIIKALSIAKYNRQAACEILGMSRSKLWRKMKEYGI